MLHVLQSSQSTHLYTLDNWWIVWWGFEAKLMLTLNLLQSSLWLSTAKKFIRNSTLIYSIILVNVGSLLYCCLLCRIIFLSRGFWYFVIWPTWCSICNLQNEDSGLYTGDGSVDVKGKPVLKQNTGNWKACPFILGDLLFTMFLMY